MSAIIKVENLSKRFIISHEQRESHTSLRDVVTRKVKKTFSFAEREGISKAATTTDIAVVNEPMATVTLKIKKMDTAIIPKAEVFNYQSEYPY